MIFDKYIPKWHSLSESPRWIFASGEGLANSPVFLGMGDEEIDESQKAGDLIRSLLYLFSLLQRGSDTN